MVWGQALCHGACACAHRHLRGGRPRRTCRNGVPRHRFGDGPGSAARASRRGPAGQPRLRMLLTDAVAGALGTRDVATAESAIGSSANGAILELLPQSSRALPTLQTVLRMLNGCAKI